MLLLLLLFLFLLLFMLLQNKHYRPILHVLLSFDRLLIGQSVALRLLDIP